MVVVLAYRKVRVAGTTSCCRCCTSCHWSPFSSIIYLKYFVLYWNSKTGSEWKWLEELSVAANTRLFFWISVLITVGRLLWRRSGSRMLRYVDANIHEWLCVTVFTLTVTDPSWSDRNMSPPHFRGKCTCLVAVHTEVFTAAAGTAGFVQRWR